MDLLPKPEQTLVKQQLIEPHTEPYLLSDASGVFISFATAQEAVAWIEQYTPNAITHFQIV